MMAAVVVHGVEIPERLIADEAQHHPGPTAAASRTAAAHALATKALLLRRASELGLKPFPERDEAGREETEEAALVRAVLEAEVETCSPTEAECRRIYEARRGMNRPYEEVAEAIRAHLQTRAWTVAAMRYVVSLAEATRGKGIVATLDEGGVRAGTLCLGDMIGDREATRSLLQWLEKTDSHLFFLVLEEASDRRAEPAQLVCELVAAFVARADDEAWTNVVSAARNGEDPAHAALTAVLKATLPKAGGRLCCGGDRCAH